MLSASVFRNRSCDVRLPRMDAEIRIDTIPIEESGVERHFQRPDYLTEWNHQNETESNDNSLCTRNPRACARIQIARGPGESLCCLDPFETRLLTT